MNKRNIDLHGPKLSPSEQASRLRGLETRYELNRQLIQFLRTYGGAADLLLREYGATRQFPERCKNFQEAKRIVQQQIPPLLETQKMIQAEMDDLRGQLPLPEPPTGI